MTARDQNKENTRRGNLAGASRIMEEYACLTGLAGGGGASQRYLWTDAFAVCNCLELFCLTDEKSHLDRCLSLVDQVHHILGRHRGDDPRRGWISGLDEPEGERHPTAGGLRIGKNQKERRPEEPFDERLEWEKDGQYYHYLTKWMHALRCVYRVTGDPVYWRWAVELAKIAHRSFTYRKERMYWKMSIDLSRPAVVSMGQHDPLDGFVTYCELEAAGEDLPDTLPLGLKEEISEMAGICRRSVLPTSDPLGIGGLLFDSSRIAQLMMKRFLKGSGLLEAVLASARIGLEAYLQGRELEQPVEHRLAFRELGLAIGLAGAEELAIWRQERPDTFPKREMNRHMDAIVEFLPVKEKIESFWQEERNQQASSWKDHQEINMVMLATSLAPGQFLLI